MKTDSIAKLYRGLTNKERAGLAFRYLTDTNKLELDRVVAAVPRKAYLGPDAEYLAWFDGIFYLASLWAIEHWKAQTCYFAALADSHLEFGTENVAKAKRMSQANEYWESRLLALDCALVTVCVEHGIDSDDVRRLAGAEPFTSMRTAMAADKEYQDAMQSNLARLLPAAHGPK